MASDYRDEPKAMSRTMAERVATLETRLSRFDEDMAEAQKMINHLTARVETAENELGIER